MMHQKSILFFILLFYFGCNQSTESQDIYGCTISSACNFNTAATIIDDSCINEPDCWGECGTAILDECGVCGGSATHIANCENEYGECPDSMILGCNGICDAIPSLIDECGICGGDGSSCPKIMLSVSPSSILVEQRTALEVNLANIQNLYALSFEILFNNSMLEIEMESGVVSYDQFTGDNFGPVIYVDDGIVSFVLGGNNIEGKVFSVNIKGLQAGVTNVTLDKVNLIQEDGKDVFNYSSLILEDVEITVTSE